MQAVIRLLPYQEGGGAYNMAADEVMLHSASAGTPSLRLYGWTTATMSIGYFQSAAVCRAEPRLAALPWVRRPSGGATLVHHHELTYAVALPGEKLWHQPGLCLARMHRVIAAALANFGLHERVETAGSVAIKHGDILCFQQFTGGDLLCLGKKVVGSAQRKYREAVMQHGSILLEQSEHTPELPGILELTGIRVSISQMQVAFLNAFATETGLVFKAGDWDAAELAAIEAKKIEKYANASWNERR